ncbi:MAG: T9SS type A sorting domain-containing protein [Candidatus Kapabacteria bacterium]|nr:T9SS type A sorting domain-containing protein [Candidatus Kapabacteria bacterium]
MKAIDKIFDDISRTKLPEFPLSDSEIRLGLSEIDKNKKNKNSNKRGIIIMGILSVLIIILINFLFFQNPENNSELKQISDLNSKNHQTTENISSVNENKSVIGITRSKSDTTEYLADNHSFQTNDTILHVKSQKLSRKDKIQINRMISEYKSQSSKGQPQYDTLSEDNEEINQNIETDNLPQIRTADDELLIKRKIDEYLGRTDKVRQNVDSILNISNKLETESSDKTKEFLKKLKDKELPKNLNSFKKVELTITDEEQIKKIKEKNFLNPLDTNKVKSINNNITIDYTTKDTEKVDIDSIEVLVLTDDELEKINIKKVDCGYLFLTELVFPDLTNNISGLESYGYPKQGLARAVYLVTDSFRFQLDYLKNPNWEMTKSLGIFPVGLNLYRADSNKQSYLASSFGYGLFKTPKIIHNNQIISGRLLSDLRKIFDRREIVNSIKIYFNKQENENLKASIPIFLKVNSDISSGYIILKYLATRNFISLLPKRYKFDNYNHLFSHQLEYFDANEINNQFHNAVFELGNACKHNSLVKSNLQNKEPKEIKQIAGIEKLFLTTKEAEKIGISKNGDTLSTLFEDYINKDDIPFGGLEMISKMYNYDTTKQNILFKSNPYIIINNFQGERGIKIQPNIYTGWDYSIWSDIAAVGMMYQSVKIAKGVQASTVVISQISQSPLLKADSINDGYIEIDNIVKRDSMGNYKPLLWNLLPVRIEWKEYEGSDTISNNVDFWFYISRKFAELLPDRYKIPILKELDIISRVEDGLISPDDACKELKGEVSYLGVCKLKNDLFISLNIYPNPVTSNQINIGFSLKAENRLKFELYNYDGKFIGTLKDFSDYTLGNIQLNMPLPETGQGVYFLNISDDKGSSVNEKFIKLK